MERNLLERREEGAGEQLHGVAALEMDLHPRVPSLQPGERYLQGRRANGRGAVSSGRVRRLAAPPAQPIVTAPSSSESRLISSRPRSAMASASSASTPVRPVSSSIVEQQLERAVDEVVRHQHPQHGGGADAVVEPRTLLVEMLRDKLGLTGTHVGCDTSQCGACTVHLDGRSIKGEYTILAVQAAGRNVTAIEGSASADRQLASDEGRIPRVPAMQPTFSIREPARTISPTITPTTIRRTTSFTTLQQEEHHRPRWATATCREFIPPRRIRPFRRTTGITAFPTISTSSPRTLSAMNTR